MFLITFVTKKKDFEKNVRRAS